MWADTQLYGTRVKHSWNHPCSAAGTWGCCRAQQSHCRCVPSSLPAASLCHKASSLAQCPPMALGSAALCLLTFRNATITAGIYIYILSAVPAQRSPLLPLPSHRGKIQRGTLLCFYFCLLNCRTPHSLASSLLKSDFHSTKYRNSALCRG